MELEVTRPSANTVVISLAGRLDARTVARFDEESRAWSGSARLLLDFSGLAYLSSAGLRSLLVLARRQVAAGGSFAIFRVPEGVRDVLAVSGFDRMLPMLANADEALQGPFEKA